MNQISHLALAGISLLLIIVIGAVLLGRTKLIVRLLPVGVLLVAIVAFTNGAGNSISQQCGAGFAPNDVTQPADNCGVQPLLLGQNSALPIAPNVGVIELDLYIEGQVTCGVLNFVLCGIDDNRPFVPSGAADPHADASRNRVHMILNFNTGQLQVRISPSCRIHPLGVGFNGKKECFAPKPIGQGTSLSVSPQSPGRSVAIDLDVIQTNYVSPGSVGQIENEFVVSANGGRLSLSGQGTAFPDLALIRGNTVVYAVQDTHIANVFPPRGLTARQYSYVG